MGATALTALPVDPVGSIDEAIARMQEIAALLPPTDGLSCFNRMYLTVTLAIRDQVGAGFYADAAFMALLDVTFVNRYLAAVSAYRAEPRSAPRAWRVLLACRSDRTLAPLQFALAGMNAHINFDLAPALVQTCKESHTAPDRGSYHADFEKVNRTLDALAPQVRQSFEEGVLLELDREFGELADLADGFSISAGRESAWVNAEVLWALRQQTLLSRSFLRSLDRTVGFAGRALLTRLPRLA